MARHLSQRVCATSLAPHGDGGVAAAARMMVGCKHHVVGADRCLRCARAASTISSPAMSSLLRSDRDQWEPLHARSDSSEQLQMDGQLDHADDDAGDEKISQPGTAASSTNSASGGGGGGGDGATDDEVGGGSGGTGDDVVGIAATARSGASMSDHHELISRIDQHLSGSSLAVADVSAISVSGDGSAGAVQQAPAPHDRSASFLTHAELLEAINRERRISVLGLSTDENAPRLSDRIAPHRPLRTGHVERSPSVDRPAQGSPSASHEQLVGAIDGLLAGPAAQP
jgi:hypothetical protein